MTPEQYRALIEKIDAQGDKIDAQGKKIDAQGKTLTDVAGKTFDLDQRVKRVEDSAANATRVAMDSAHDLDMTKAAFALRMDTLQIGVNDRFEKMATINEDQSTQLSTLVKLSGERKTSTNAWSAALFVVAVVGALVAHGDVPVDQFAGVVTGVGLAVVGVLTAANRKANS